MARPAVWLATGFCLFLFGCSLNQPAAPVRDYKSAKRAAKPPQARPEFYRVQPGDTLFRIAFDHGFEYRQLAQWNGLDDPARIRVGDLLRLKPPLERPAAAAAKPASQAAPPPDPPELPDTPPGEWVWPAKGQVIKRFEGGAGGNGLDIAGPRGSPVQAAAPGRVVYVGAGLRGYGKLIIIKHNQTLLTAYGHNERVLVIEGQNVKMGQAIAEMGDSDADRVKLHFEIREYGKPVDPMNYLPG
jgi:lipoprotein NlpD